MIQYDYERLMEQARAMFAADQLSRLFRRLVPDFPTLDSSEGAIGSNRFYVRMNLRAEQIQPLIDALSAVLD